MHLPTNLPTFIFIVLLTALIFFGIGYHVPDALDYLFG
jgi:hypothetical protein